MSEERLGGKFTIDITDLRAGLQEANRLIRASESQFRASAAGMDDWSKSEEGLTARQQTLNKQIEIQKEKIAALVREKNNVIEKMTQEGKSQEQIAKAIDGTNKQITSESKALDKLKTELNRTESALDDMGDATKEAGEEATKTSGHFTVMKGALANLVADGFRKAIDAAKDFAKSMVTTAAEVKAANSQYSQAFGELESEATEAISNIAKSTGILETRLQGTAANIYSFARSSGATSAEAMELMQEALIATADSAAYYDKSLEDSAETLQSFLKGNFANDAALGISATEFTRNAKATELFGKKYNDLTEIEKQKTLLKMVTDGQKLSGAMGQAARESDGFENVMGNLNEAYTQFQAKVGTPVLNSLIPVIKEATASFQDFEQSIDWEDFNQKATEKLEDFIDTAKTLGKNALPVLKVALNVTGKALKFVADNFQTLGTVTLTAVTAFKAFKAAMAISTAITATKTAVAGLTAGVGLATKAQTAWNAAMTANPIGAVLTAVGLLTAGIILLAASEDKATKSTDVLSKSQRNAVKAAEDAAEAFKDTKKAADELTQGEIANINYTQSLWHELQTLTDQNGKVKEGYEGRAQFILNELNSALNTEYTMNGNIIQSYKDIAESIDIVIQKKKAQILLEGYESTYLDAIKNVSSAEKARATQAQELFLQEEIVEQKRAAVIALRTKLEDAYDGRTRMVIKRQIESAQRALNDEEDVLKQKQDKYNETDNLLQGYYNNITNYETASGLVMQGETEKALGYLDKLNGGYETVKGTAQEVAEAKKKALEEDVINTQINVALLEEEYERLADTMTEEEKEQAAVRLTNAKKAADDAIIAFNEVGGNITKGIANGAESEENTNWTLSGAMKSVIGKALAAARKAAQEHSPSRLFRNKVGIGLSQGIAVGVSDGTKDVVKSVKKQINDIQNAYDLDDISSSLDVGINTKASKSGSTAKSKTSGGVVVNQYNTYSQTHSRLELYKTKQQTAAAVRLALGEV